jgi:uncharacterized protein YukE
VGLVLPAELQWLEWIVGSDWPEGDETAMRRGAQAWVDVATDINELIGDLQATAAKVLGTVDGEGAEAFRKYFGTYVSTDPQCLPKLSKACEALGQALNSGANEIEYAKYMFIALLIITAIEITMLIASAVATFGASTAAIPAVEVASQITARTIAQKLLIAIAKGALRGFLEGVLLDLGVQGLQITQGNRDGIDWKKTGSSALDGR